MLALIDHEESPVGEVHTGMYPLPRLLLAEDAGAQRARDLRSVKAAEVAGLTTMIVVLGAVVTILLTVITGKLGMTPSLALTVGNFDLKNKVHLLLAAVNVFSFWQIGVAACGLARLTGKPFSKALLLVGLYWLAFTLFFIGIGFGQMAM